MESATDTDTNTESAVPLLDLRAVVAGYGGGAVLRGIDLVVPRGQVTCVIGPNGAGKSTILRVVSGLLAPTSGEVVYEGRPLGSATPRDRLRAGIAHVPQERSLFPALTVGENLLMGGYLLGRDKALMAQRLAAARAEFPLVADRRTARAGSLSGGEQRQVEIARALMSDPALLLLDEPTIGLAPKARVAVFEAVARLRESGRTVLMVEQNARSGLAAADLGVIVETGRVRRTAPGSQLLADPEVGRLFLGSGRAQH